MRKFNEMKSGPTPPNSRNPIKDWKVVDLLDLRNEIQGGTNNRRHPVNKEWEYMVREKAHGNDRGVYHNIDMRYTETPIIDQYLMDNYGFKDKEVFIFWVCW